MSDVFNPAPVPQQERARASWRNDWQIHPAADQFPLLPPDEQRALGKDIVENGLKSRIALWQADARSPLVLLDGRNRLDALEAHTGCQVQVVLETAPRSHTAIWSIKAGEWIADEMVVVLDGSVDPYAYVISANIHRRHLTAEQKRDLIAKLIKATPDKSDRQIAETVKVSPTTVGAVRREVVSPTVQSGQLPPKRIGKDGRVRKVANKPKQKVLSAPPKVSPAAAQNRDDVDLASNGEISQLQARVDELQAELRQREIKFTGLESENRELKQQAVKPTGDEPLTVLIELLRQILTDANQPAWLEPLSPRKQQQARKLVERLRSDLYDLVELRQTAAKAMTNITPPPPGDELDIPDFLDRTREVAP
jgi:hypothetical protein